LQELLVYSTDIILPLIKPNYPDFLKLKLVNNSLALFWSTNKQ